MTNRHRRESDLSLHQIKKEDTKMIRSNSKQAKERIKAYIMESIDLEAYSPKYDHIIEAQQRGEDTFSAICQAIKETIFEEKEEHDLRRNLSKYDYFEEWLSGLPTFFDADYYYRCNAKEILGDILEETEEERDRFTEEQAEETLTRLLFREIYR